MGSIGKKEEYVRGKNASLCPVLFSPPQIPIFCEIFAIHFYPNATINLSWNRLRSANWKTD